MQGKGLLTKDLRDLSDVRGFCNEAIYPAVSSTPFNTPPPQDYMAVTIASLLGALPIRGWGFDDQNSHVC